MFLVKKMKDKLHKWLFTLPVTIYSILLILLPLVYIFIISFFKSDSYGGMITTRQVLELGISKTTLTNYVRSGKVEPRTSPSTPSL